MKKLNRITASFILLSGTLFLYSCDSSADKGSTAIQAGAAVSQAYDEVNEELAAEGKTLFKNKCAACHQMDTRTLGPALRGVTERRSHNWLESMLQDPEGWVKKDAEAKKLFEEYNKIPMIIAGGTTADERKAIINYLRSEDLNK
ncbi:MAG: c-type cytochrome [Cytophagaceae bacterium]